MTPPTQYLRPPVVEELTDQDRINDILDQLEEKGTVLKRHTLSELRVKVRRKWRYDLDLEPPPRIIFDSIISERLNRAA
jgi:hypothetical protein